MKRAIFPGSFDPPTLAHFSVYLQARAIFDEVVVVVADNATKSGCLLNPTERVEAWCSEIKNAVVVIADSHLSIVNQAKLLEATHIVRGFRGPGDIEHEHAFYDFVNRNSLLKLVHFSVPSYLRTCSSTRSRSIVGLQDWKAYAVQDVTDNVVAIIDKALQKQRGVHYVKNPGLPT